MKYRIINDVFIGSTREEEFKKEISDFLIEHGGSYTDDFLGNGFEIINGSLTLDYRCTTTVPELFLEILEFSARHSLSHSIVLQTSGIGVEYAFEKWLYLPERDAVICQKGNLEFPPIPDIAYYDVVKDGKKINENGSLVEVELFKFLELFADKKTCRKLKQEFYARLDDQRRLKGVVAGGNLLIFNSGEFYPIKD